MKSDLTNLSRFPICRQHTGSNVFNHNYHKSHGAKFVTTEAPHERPNTGVPAAGGTHVNSVGPPDELFQISEIQKRQHFSTAFCHRAINIIQDKKKNNKGDLILAHVDETLREAIQKMLYYDVGCLLVTRAEADQICGIIYEKNLFRRIAVDPMTLHSKVATLTMYEFPTVGPADTVGHCLQAFLRFHVQYLPVKTSEQAIIGVLSTGDIIKSLMQEYEDTINVLRDYITRTDFQY